MAKELDAFVKEAKEGKSDAFGKLFELTNQKAYYTALKITENPRDAEDMVQEAYVKAFASLDTLNDDSKFEKWLNRIVANKCRDLAKKHKPDLFSDYDNDDEDFAFEESVQNADVTLLPEEVTENKAVKKLVMKCVDKLPDEQRMCVVMYYYNELSIDEISDTLGIPSGTVKSRLSKARKTLKSRFKDIENKDNIKLHSLSLPLVMSLAFRLSGESCKIPTLSLVRITKSVSDFISDGSAPSVLKAIGFSTLIKRVIAGFGAAAIITGGSIAARDIIDDKKTESVSTTTAVVAQYQPLKSNKKRKTKAAIQTVVDSISDKIITPSAVAVADENNNIYYIDNNGVVCSDKNGNIRIISEHKPLNLYYGDSLMFIYNDMLYQYNGKKLKEYMPVKGDYLYGGSYRLVSISADKNSAFLIDLDKRKCEDFEQGSSDFKYLGKKLYFRSLDNSIKRAVVKKEKVKVQDVVSFNSEDQLRLPYTVKNGKIYYTDFDSDVTGIVHIKNIKTEEIESIKLNGGIKDLTVSEDSIYYSLTKCGIFMYNNEEGITKIADGDYYCGATSRGNMIWCNAFGNDAYLIKSGEAEPIAVINGDEIIEFSIVNDVIYYRGDSGYDCKSLRSDDNG